jgi:hypothetical protein
MKKPGAPRKYKYKGEKMVTSIRLSDEEKEKIARAGFSSVQHFIQHFLGKIRKSKPRK